MLYRIIATTYEGPLFTLRVSPWYETLEALDLATRTLGTIAHGALEALDLESDGSFPESRIEETWIHSVPERFADLHLNTTYHVAMRERGDLRRCGHSETSVARALHALYVGQVTLINEGSFVAHIGDMHDGSVTDGSADDVSVGRTRPVDHSPEV